MSYIPEGLNINTDLNGVTIFEINSVTVSLARKLKSELTKIFEFNLRIFSKLLKNDLLKAQRMIRTTYLCDKLGIPLIVTSGAQNYNELKPPLQLIYTLSGLLEKNNVSKKYLSFPFRNTIDQ